MALTDTVMKMVTRQPKDGKEPDQSATEKMIKSKAGLVINIFAALLAFNMWLQGSLNSKVMNNTIQANDIWAFYQAKSIKQTQYELAAQQTTDPVKADITIRVKDRMKTRITISSFHYLLQLWRKGEGPRSLSFASSC